MANSVLKDKQGDWPLGYVNVPTSGTPVSIMTNVDPSLVNDPSKPTPGTSGADEYTVRCQQMIFQGFHPSGGKMVANSGNVYLIRQPSSGGTGNLTDTGVIALIIPAGQTAVLASAPLNRNVFNPYRYRLDADNN